MSKKDLVIMSVSLMLVLSLSLVSAGWFSDLFVKEKNYITGHVVSDCTNGVCKIQPSSVEALITEQSVEPGRGLSIENMTDGDVTTYWRPGNTYVSFKFTYPELIEGESNITYSWRGESPCEDYLCDCPGKIEISADDITYKTAFSGNDMNLLESFVTDESFKYLKVTVGMYDFGMGGKTCGSARINDLVVTQEVQDKEVTCADSDGGRNYYIKGTLTPEDLGGNLPYGQNFDSCQSNRVLEVYCDGENPTYEFFECQGNCVDGACECFSDDNCGEGYVCENDICVEASEPEENIPITYWAYDQEGNLPVSGSDQIVIPGETKFYLILKNLDYVTSDYVNGIHFIITDILGRYEVSEWIYAEIKSDGEGNKYATYEWTVPSYYGFFMIYAPAYEGDIYSLYFTDELTEDGVSDVLNLTSTERCTAECRHSGSDGWYDSCTNDLIEYGNNCVAICSSDGDCPSDYPCIEGDCVKYDPVCVDSDGGLNYYLDGDVGDAILIASEDSPNYDLCVGDDLREMFCNSDGRGEPRLYTCHGGCEDGACIQNEIFYYPETFVDIINNELNVNLIYDFEGSAVEAVQSGNIYSDLSNYLSNPSNIENLFTDSEIDGARGQNLIVIGTISCGNSAIDSVLGEGACELLASELSEDKFLIKSFEDPLNKGKVVLVVLGYDLIDLIDGVRYLTSTTLNISFGASYILSSHFCGDGTCDGDETCSSCESDCGSCNVDETNSCVPLVENGVRVSPQTRLRVSPVEIEIDSDFSGSSSEVKSVYFAGERYNLSLENSGSTIKVKKGENIQYKSASQASYKLDDKTYLTISDGSSDNAIGVKLDITNPVYCDPSTLTYVEVGTNGDYCVNDYECLSNVCIDGECTSVREELEEQRGLIEVLLCYVKSIFGETTIEDCQSLEED